MEDEMNKQIKCSCYKARKLYQDVFGVEMPMEMNYFKALSCVILKVGEDKTITMIEKED